MRHYRALFDDLVEPDEAHERIVRERSSDEPAPEDNRQPSEERTVR